MWRATTLEIVFRLRRVYCKVIYCDLRLKASSLRRTGFGRLNPGSRKGVSWLDE
jgi:hypothetical protein